MNVQNPSAAQQWPEQAFEPVEACLWCASERLSVEVSGVRDWFFDAVPGEFEFARCEDCGSLVLLRRPTAEFLPAAYSGYYTHGDTERSGARVQGLAAKLKSEISSAYIRSRYTTDYGVKDAVLGQFYRLFTNRRREIDVNLRFLPQQPGTVFDYGCGNGSFLSRAKAKGHRVFGVDFDPGAIEAATKNGIEVALPDDADGVLQHGPFDHISAAHVIEHVADPNRLLASFHGWMKKGGTLFLELPNAKAAGLAEYGEFWRGLEAPRHFSLPTRTILREALENSGFSNVEYHPRASVKPWLWAESRSAIESLEQLETATPRIAADLSEEEFLTVTARAV